MTSDVEAIQAVNQARSIYAKLESLIHLPTLPPVIGRLQEAIRDPECGARRVCAIVEDDPAMMMRILQVVNSPLYAGLAPVSSLELAVTRLGFTTIVNIAISTSVFTMFGRQEQNGFDRVGFWRHSISTGIATQVLYERARPGLESRHPVDLLHLVGLLHDLGKIVLGQHFSADFMAAVDQAGARKVALDAAERDVLGTDHAEVGSWLGMRWNLAPEVLQVVRWHHNPAQASLENRELVMLVHAADYICNLERVGNGGNSKAPEFHQSTWIDLGLSTRDIPAVLDEVTTRSGESEVLLAIAQPDPAARG